ncbi:sugar phosphate isomerase/epimerase family protein [Brachybacterium sp. AOP25-B2-12]|uniref:sugar phosphate isomerase/epimerase family protein n=1 Tax=Brachybacterium sp. AOP25-B2-12 TaxID=3457710 RepID=UPI0040335243
MKTSVQLYSVREALAADPLRTFETLKDAGFARVEPFGLVEHAQILRDGLAATGLTAPTTHASLLAAEDPSAAFGLAAELGIGTVIDPYWEPTDFETAEGVRGVADRLNALVPVARQHGVGVGYHNHAFELRNRIDGRPALVILAELLDPAVALEVDTYWAAVGGVDPAALLTELGERVRFAHLKDGPISEDPSAQLPLGQGRIDVPAILAAAPWLELGVIEFDDYAGDTLEGVEQSLRHLEHLLGATEEEGR